MILPQDFAVWRPIASIFGKGQYETTAQVYINKVKVNFDTGEWIVPSLESIPRYASQICKQLDKNMERSMEHAGRLLVEYFTVKPFLKSPEAAAQVCDSWRMVYERSNFKPSAFLNHHTPYLSKPLVSSYNLKKIDSGKIINLVVWLTEEGNNWKRAWFSKEIKQAIKFAGISKKEASDYLFFVQSPSHLALLCDEWKYISDHVGKNKSAHRERRIWELSRLRSG